MTKHPRLHGLTSGFALTLAAMGLSGRAEAQDTSRMGIGSTVPLFVNPDCVHSHLVTPTSQPNSADLAERLYASSCNYLMHNKKEVLSLHAAQATIQTLVEKGELQLVSDADQKKELYAERQLDEAMLQLFTNGNPVAPTAVGQIVGDPGIRIVYNKLVKFLVQRDANIQTAELNMINYQGADLTREATMLTFVSDLIQGGTLTGTLSVYTDPAHQLQALKQHYVGLQMAKIYQAADIDYVIRRQDDIKSDPKHKVVSFPASSLGQPDQLGHDFLAARNGAAWFKAKNRGWTYPREAVCGGGYWSGYFCRPTSSYYAAGPINQNLDYNLGLNFDPMFAWDTLQPDILQDLRVKVAEPKPDWMTAMDAAAARAATQAKATSAARSGKRGQSAKPQAGPAQSQPADNAGSATTHRPAMPKALHPKPPGFQSF